MIFVLVVLLLGVAYGKIYDRCELARELKYVHEAASHQLATWVCIAEHESQYNTSIVGHLNGDGSGDHGIFQISDQYWCSPPGKGYACGLTCAELEDDDISDDFICAQKIYKEHKHLSGDGFNAWAVYQPHCKGSKADRYIKDCFNDSERPKTFTTPGTAFAHGFFDTAAGRAHKPSLMYTQKPAFEQIFNYRTPSVIQSQTFPTEKPFVNSFPAPKSSFFMNQFSTSTETPKFNFFFTPTTSMIIKSTKSTTASFIPITTKPPINNLILFNPTPSTFAPPTISRTPIFEFTNTISPPSNRMGIFNPLVSTSAYQSTTVRYPTPIFIINGVKWY